MLTTINCVIIFAAGFFWGAVLTSRWYRKNEEKRSKGNLRFKNNEDGKLGCRIQLTKNVEVGEECLLIPKQIRKKN